MEEKIKVSISCITYNHGKYIKEALDSFLNQKTNFKYEILVHDDASTDETSQIVKEYEKNYPDIIKPIYQKENQYSKGHCVSDNNYNRAKGKYIAICEGDDFWIDNQKLQKQIDYLETHPICTFCFTNGKIKNMITNKEDIFMKEKSLNNEVFSEKSRKYNLGELGVLGFIPTASFVFPRHILNNVPDFYYNKYPFGDFKMKLIATMQGYAYYMNDITCIYRKEVLNSATQNWNKLDKQNKIKLYEKFIEFTDLINSYMKFEYNKNFDKLRIYFEITIAKVNQEKKILTNIRYRNYLKKLTKKEFISLYLMICYPRIHTKIKIMKNKIVARKSIYAK